MIPDVFAFLSELAAYGHGLYTELVTWLIRSIEPELLPAASASQSCL